MQPSVAISSISTRRFRIGCKVERLSGVQGNEAAGNVKRSELYRKLARISPAIHKESGEIEKVVCMSYNNKRVTTVLSQLCRFTSYTDGKINT